MRIVVLAKPVPDATGGERLTPDLRLDRDAIPAVVNGNDEYALEEALKQVEAHGGDVSGSEVTVLMMAPPSAAETMRKALAMGAHRGVIVSDPALTGSCAVSTVRVLAAALRKLEFDLVLAGADTVDGNAGVVGAGVAAQLGLPYLSYAARVQIHGGERVRVQRISPTGFDVIEAPLPAVVIATQALGAPRYPSLKGIMAARSREVVTWSLADLGLSADEAGGTAATTRVLGAREPGVRAEARIIREPADEAARQVVEFLASRRLV